MQGRPGPMFDIRTQTPDDALPVHIGASEQTSHEQIPTALAQQLEALAKLPTSTLRQQWCRLYKTQPPRRITRDLLMLAVSWKMQARSLGGLGAPAKRKLTDLARKSKQQGTAATCNAIRLKPGTRLVREWHGDIHEIMVLEAGFEWRGRHYRSLSKIAQEITGAHWSGPRFFGLKPKPDNFAHSGGRSHA